MEISYSIQMVMWNQCLKEIVDTEIIEALLKVFLTFQKLNMKGIFQCFISKERILNHFRMIIFFHALFLKSLRYRYLKNILNF